LDSPIVPWTDPKIDAPNGKNFDLTRRYQAALEIIREREKRSARGRMREAEAEIAALRWRVDALILQNAELIEKLDHAERELRRAQAKMAAWANEQNYGLEEA
jgi:hypothetical protein